MKVMPTEKEEKEILHFYFMLKVLSHFFLSRDCCPFRSDNVDKHSSQLQDSLMNTEWFEDEVDCRRVDVQEQSPDNSGKVHKVGVCCHES